MTPKIKNLIARQIIDSRANPTVEADILLEDGSFGRASVPSGASTGDKEAKEIRDNDPEQYRGMGVVNAVEIIEEDIFEHLVNRSFTQEELDQDLIDFDGTKDKSRLGANAILAVSLAYSKALAYNANVPLHLYIGQKFLEYEEMPRAMFNILNGGAHADNGLSFQEFMIVPQKNNFHEDTRCAVEIYHSLKNILKEKGLTTSVGDEGGFAPVLEKNETALEIIEEAGLDAGYVSGKDFWLSLDIAANEINKENKYLHNGEMLEKEEFVSEIVNLSENFPILSIEDPFHEDDRESFIKLNKLIGEKVIIVGDDYLVTDPQKIERAAKEKSVGGVIIKPNQIGTVTEALMATTVAMKNKLLPIFSHRSGETEDVGIAHLAVASRAPLVKFGAPARGERTAKYNELLRIEEEMLANRLNL